MDQVGHADSKTTLEIYAHVQKRLSRSQVKRAFEALLAGTDLGSPGIPEQAREKMSRQTSGSAESAPVERPKRAVYPARGIGPVRIGDSKTSVERALRQPSSPCHASCLRTYPGRRGNLRVNYLHGAVNNIESTSTRITLRGRRLGLGSRRLRSVLTHWTYLRCQGYVFGNGPSTTISFGPHGTVDVTVFSDRIGGCGAP